MQLVVTISRRASPVDECDQLACRTRDTAGAVDSGTVVPHAFSRSWLRETRHGCLARSLIKSSPAMLPKGQMSVIRPLNSLVCMPVCIHN